MQDLIIIEGFRIEPNEYLDQFGTETARPWSPDRPPGHQNGPLVTRLALVTDRPLVT